MNAPSAYDEKMYVKLDRAAIAALGAFYDELSGAKWEIQNLDELLHSFAEKNGVKIGKFMPTLRCALLGKSGGIGVCEALFVLGLEESLARFRAFMAFAG